MSTVPTLPSAAPSFVPTLPGRTTAPSVSTAPVASAPVAHPSGVPVDAHAGQSARPDERPAAPAALFRTGWLRRVAIWASAASVPGFFVGDYVGAALTLLSLIALIVWSVAAAINARRARSATIHGTSPHPAMVLLSWFVAPIVGGLAVVAITSAAMWADSGDFDEEGARTMVLVGTVLIAGLATLVAAYLPYRALAKCAKWVNADAGRFRRWFAAPIVAALLAGVAQILAGLVVLTDGADGSSSNATIGAAALWMLSFTLPWLAWLVFGSRAMRALDLGVTHAHGRALRESLGQAELDPLLVGQAVAAGVPMSAL